MPNVKRERVESSGTILKPDLGLLCSQCADGWFSGKLVRSLHLYCAQDILSASDTPQPGRASELSQPQPEPAFLFSLLSFRSNELFVHTGCVCMQDLP